MIRSGVGQSAKAAAALAAQEAAQEAMAQAGVGRADAAVVFFTVEHGSQQPQLIETLRRIVGTDQIVGCSAAGVLSGAGETEGSPGVAVLVLASDQMQSRPFVFQPLRERDDEVGADIARATLNRVGSDALLMLLPDTYNGQPQRLLTRIARGAGFIPVIGAGSSENGTARATYQLCGDAMVTNAVAGMCFSGTFQACIDLTQGCQPITEPMVITKAENHLIYEIDDRPAIEVFAKLLKGPLAEDVRRALMVLFVGLPAHPNENQIAPGRYVVRNIIGLDPHKGVLGVADEVREGQELIFTLRDGERAREDLNQMLRRQREILGTKKPAFGLYFNCCARGNSLYGIPGIDSAYIRQALGDFPLIGMFGGYELAPLGGANHLFAYTGVLALITE